MERATKFIQLYNQMSDYLQRTTGSSGHVTFSVMVEQAAKTNAAIRAVAGKLKEYGDLRNAIVHHRDYPETIIAEPSAEALADFTSIVEKALRPKRLLPTFQRNVRVFSMEEQLVTALKYMRDHDYSQVVVGDAGTFRLLTVEGVARWLEQQAEADIISVTDAIVGHAIAHEIPNTFETMDRNQTIFKAREAFTQILERVQPRLFAIIVTQTGRPTEQPLGIVTPWDLLRDADG